MKLEQVRASNKQTLILDASKLGKHQVLHGRRMFHDTTDYKDKFFASLHGCTS